MNFSKISKFFAAGLIFSSFGVANASESKNENATVSVESKEAVDKKDEANVNSENNAKSEEKKDMDKLDKIVGQQNYNRSLGTVSIKKSESSSEASFIVEQFGDGTVVVRDIGISDSADPNSVSNVRVYSYSTTKSYDVRYKPQEGFVYQEVESSNSKNDSSDSNNEKVTSNSEENSSAPATADKNA